MRAWAVAAPPRAVRWVAGAAGATALAFAVLLWPTTKVGLAPTLLWAATVLVATVSLLGLARSRRRQRALAAAARQPLEEARISSLRPGGLVRSPSVVGGGVCLLLGCGLAPFVQPQRPALLLGLSVALLGLGLVWVGVRRWHWAGRPETSGVPILYGLKGGRVSILAGGGRGRVPHRQIGRQWAAYLGSPDWRHPRRWLGRRDQGRATGCRNDAVAAPRVVDR